MAAAGAVGGRLHDLTTPDGTGLCWWDNGVPPTAGAKLPVVVSNGLGASPAAWPFLLSGPRHAVTWHHRGLGGSQRPADESRITVDDHVADMIAVMDAAGIGRALVIGWSVGVGVALEVARRAPDRVAGLLLLGGVAGGGFRVLPAGTPAVLQKGLGTASAWLLRVVGPPVAGMISLLPRGLDALGAVSTPVSDPLVFTPPAVRTLAEVAREFARHDWTWFSRLVLAAGAHGAVPVDGLAVPVTVVAGEFDTLAPVEEMAALAHAVPDGRLVRVPGTHFLPLQYPELLHAELEALARRAR